jgi:hypothetical protein
MATPEVRPRDWKSPKNSHAGKFGFCWFDGTDQVKANCPRFGHYPN